MEECGCKEKKEHTLADMITTQPPAVWVALAVGFVVASVIRK